jgi:hypothetical protein
VVAAVEEEEVEDTPTGTIDIQAAIITPVATPTGMKTFGLDIVVKFNASRCFVRLNAQSCLFSRTCHRKTFYHRSRQQISSPFHILY